MVLLQQLEKVKLETFGDISEFLLKRILNTAIVYFVTDQYKATSIKALERKRRGVSTGSIRYRIERRDQRRPKQWAKYLRDPLNKGELTEFLLADWSSQRFKHLVSGHVLFVNVHSKFWKISSNNEEVHYLETIMLKLFSDSLNLNKKLSSR